MVIVAPVETVKTKVIELNMSFVAGLKHIIKTEGLGGIYQGAIATAMKQGSNSGLRFMWFNEYKKRVTNDGEIPLTPLMGLFGGMSAGCFSTLGNNPFDVVKVSLQRVMFIHLSDSVHVFLAVLESILKPAAPICTFSTTRTHGYHSATLPLSFPISNRNNDRRGKM